MNKKYELICLISTRIDEEERDTVIENINKLIKEKGGETIETMAASEVSLGYAIKKETEAQLVVFKFEYENLNLTEFKKEVESDKRIIRSFLRKEFVKKIIPSSRRTTRKDKKVELEDIDKKIEEIFSSTPPTSDLKEETTGQEGEADVKKDESK
ncbi:MAG: 30S ribosomal protein S6 [Patescibacteria group bacterium]|nr:30S ribosomal protein S6 [Patescibacteria group bacterium]